MSMVYESQGKTTQAATSVSIGMSLVMRTVLFLLFGILAAGICAVFGDGNPLLAAEKWWPFQAIFANFATFLILRYLVRREGGQYRQFFQIQKRRLRKDFLQFVWLVPVGFVLGGVPLYLFSYLILGSLVPPDLMFQPLPLWAALVALLVFPLSNALVETPTYMGYALPRLTQATGKLWFGVLLTGMALAFQHVALPVVTDSLYMLWRFTAFLPLAIGLGLIYMRTKKLLPIVLAHYIMDLQLIVTVFLYSI